uniref:DNA-(apurinic or apyrimidinic site) lyase n=1 Tax=Lepisosteus oculatus TaxID=7918 RepID=W5NB54_LEPOC
MSRHAVLSAGSAAWRSLPCPRSELRLDLTLGCGQSFRNAEVTQAVQVTQCLKEESDNTTDTRFTASYIVSLQLNQLRACCSVNQGSKRLLEGSLSCSVAAEWSGRPALAPPLCLAVTLRSLCSSPSWRETSEGHWTGVLGGQVWTLLCLSDRWPLSQAAMWSPFCLPLASLSGSDVESTLRELGFGYRARFVQQSAKHILDTGGPDWLESLRDVPYLEAQSALRTLPGVGLKVADCVCLMSLDKPGAVPIDTHVWQIARRDYLPDLGSGHRSLTDRVYRDIATLHSALSGASVSLSSGVLFCADLKKFQRLKPEEQLKAEEESAREAEEEARGKGAELGEGGGEIAVKRKRERT